MIVVWLFGCTGSLTNNKDIRYNLIYPVILLLLPDLDQHALQFQDGKTIIWNDFTMNKLSVIMLYYLCVMMCVF